MVEVRESVDVPERRRRRRATVLLAVLAVVLAAAGCDPVSHPDFRVLEPNTGPATLRMTAGDGDFVVVESTAASETVPGAGMWRVDRRDGSAVQLPDSVQLNGMSDDGQRIAYLDPGYQLRIWVAGTIVTPPYGAILSRDLRFAMFVDVFVGQARRWELATGAITAVEAGIARPAGFTTIDGADKITGVSDDGTVVWFSLRGPSGCMTRFVNLAWPRVDDFAYCGSLLVAANGSSHVRLLDVLVSTNPLVPLGGPTRLELVNTVSHEVSRTLQPATPGAWFDGVVLAETGWNVWTVETTAQGTFPPDCGGMANPFCSGTVTAHEAVAASPNELVRFPVDPGVARSDASAAPNFTTDHGGRFMVYATADPALPVHVLDRLNANDEPLVGDVGKAKGWPGITNDGRLVTYTERFAGTSNGYYGTGWFEHETALR